MTLDIHKNSSIPHEIKDQHASQCETKRLSTVGYRIKTSSIF